MLNAPRRQKLFDATKSGDVRRVQALLDRGLDADTEGFYGERAIKLAAWHGECGVLSTLLKFGARTDDKSAELALRWAISNGHPCAVDLLLDGGVDPNANYYLGGTPLMDATERGDTRVVSLLLVHGADPNARGQYADPPKKLTADWLEYGIREKECEGTALILAARGGSEVNVTLLLKHGADPNGSDTHGCTPLRAARRHENLEAVSALSRAGAGE
jgi:ankyrin repeat protein